MNVTMEEVGVLLALAGVVASWGAQRQKTADLEARQRDGHKEFRDKISVLESRQSGTERWQAGVDSRLDAIREAQLEMKLSMKEAIHSRGAE